MLFDGTECTCQEGMVEGPDGLCKLNEDEEGFYFDNNGVPIECSVGCALCTANACTDCISGYAQQGN